MEQRYTIALMAGMYALGACFGALLALHLLSKAATNNTVIDFYEFCNLHNTLVNSTTPYATSNGTRILFCQQGGNTWLDVAEFNSTSGYVEIHAP